MKVTFLGVTEDYDSSKNNGDCILVDNGTELIVYDCGCEEHAKRVLQYMNYYGYKRCKVVLSHNDSDHFDGIPYLIDQGLVTDVYTLLLLKYKKDLLELINDKRRSRESIAKSIEEIYDNIYSLSGRVALKDIFEETELATNVHIPGPDKEYALKAVAKNIDSRQSDDIDKEKIVNAVSTQLSVHFNDGKNLLLTGDSSFKAIEETIKTHSIIQLPHHGKLEQAESIFKVKGNDTEYYVSDNTGNSNGGSDDLMKKYRKGHVIYNTISGDKKQTETTSKIITPKKTYLWG